MAIEDLMNIYNNNTNLSSTLSKVTKAAEFGVWLDFSDTSGDNMNTNLGPLQIIKNKGFHPLVGFERYNNGLTNNPSISKQSFNGKTYLVVQELYHRYRSIGEVVQNSRNLVMMNNLGTFSSAVALVVKPDDNSYPKLLLAFGNLRIHLPWNDGNVYCDMFDETYRVQTTYANMNVRNKWSVITVYCIVENGAVNCGIRVNGVNIPLTNSPTTITEPSNALGVWDLFCDNGGGNQWNGAIGEIIHLCPDSITDVQKVEGYLAHKWSLTTPFLASHPYKAAPPSNYPSQVASVSKSITQYTTNNLYLDSDATLPTLYVAYSMRLLTKTWTGACLRLQRTSDSKLVDLRFDPGTMLVDLTKTYIVGTTVETGQTAAAFVGAGDGLVDAWYDQGGRGEHAIPDGTLAAVKPRLYRAGVLQVLNGKPCVDLSTTNLMRTGRLFYSDLDTNNGYSIVNRQALGTTKLRTISARLSYNDSILHFTHGGRMSNASANAGSDIAYIRNNPNRTGAGLGIAATTAIQNYGMSQTTTTYQAYVNGVVSGIPATNPNASAAQIYNLNSGHLPNISLGEQSDVKHHELIIFTQALTTQQHANWNTNVGSYL